MDTHSLLSSDLPLDDPREDDLGYAPFARLLAEAAERMLSPEGFVIAVNGEWGSGKSTVLQFVIHYWQQVPREPGYRSCIVAPPGRLLLKADYSQIELRIAARIAGEEKMLRAYQDGEDLHILTARQVLGKAEVSKADRQLAKAVNFGLLYGMGSEGFQRYARTQYGVSVTLEEATRHRQAFFRAYPALAAWHGEVRRQKCGETRTLAYRRRLMEWDTPDTERLNTPVQGTGADGLKQALSLL